jgi:type IV secretory pathway TraG/TraD family ATPase VirD4
VYVFNPSGLGGLDSTVVFDPLVGCTDPVTATHRAGDLLSAVSSAGGAGSAERDHWVGQARRVLAALMHAAALGGSSMRDVLGWVADPGSAEQDVLSYLRRSPEPSCVEDARQFLDTNDRTRSSITTTIMPALGWLADPGAWASTQPRSDGSRVQLDIAELIELRGTVFLIGAEEAQTAPLVTALTGYIAREARRLAALCPSGRLDPGLELVLDEAALICPVPLDRWSADMGGRNIGIHIGVQSAAQLVDRFGRAAADSILTNAGAILIYGGTRSRDDLATYSMLIGEREQTQHTCDHAGRVISSTTRTVPVLSPAMISQLPAGHVVVLKRGMSPMIGRVQMAWKRAEVKAAKRDACWARRTETAVYRIRHAKAAVHGRAEACVAWAGPILLGLRQRADQLLDRIVFAGEAWFDRVPGENREQRRVRRQIEAAQRRGRERGL